MRIKKKIGIELRKRYLFQNTISKDKEEEIRLGENSRGFSLVRFEVGGTRMMTTGQRVQGTKRYVVLSILFLVFQPHLWPPLPGVISTETVGSLGQL